MKRIVTIALGSVLAVGVGAWFYRAPLLDALASQLTADMFVPADQDAFDPGLAIGARVPPLRALHDGREATSIDAFSRERGTVLVVSRSVDW